MGRKACKAPSLKYGRKEHLAAYVVKIRMRQTGAGVLKRRKRRNAVNYITC